MRLRFVLAIALLVVVSPLAGCRGSGSTAESVARGDAYLTEGKSAEAVIEFQRAIQADERNGEARHKLGLTLTKMGDHGRAVDQLVRAADLLPQNADVQLDAAKALLAVGRYEDARSRAEAVITADPRNAQAHTLRATATAGMDDVDSALRSMREAASLAPERADILVNVALIEFHQGKLQEAEAGFKQAVLLEPKSPRPLLALAAFYYRTNRSGDAEATLHRALVLEPNHVEANQALAGLYRTTNRTKQAEAPLKRLAESSGEPEAKLTLADYYIAERRGPEARAVLETLVPQAASSAAAKARLAALAYEDGKRDAAYKMLDEILEKDPRNTAVMVVRAGWLVREGKLADAQDVAAKATQIDPRSVEAHSVLGDIHVRRNNPDEAIKAYLAVLQISPSSFRTQVALAGVHLGKGRLQEARQFAQQAVASAPEVAGPRHALARVAYAEGNLSEAERQLAPVLAAAPNSVDALNLRGLILLRRGDRAQARKTFQHVLELDSRSVEALASMASLDVAEKRPGDAVSRLEAAVRRTPDDPRLLLVAGQAQALSGRLTEAETSYRKALELDPTLMEAYDALGQLHVRQNKLDAAREAYERQVAQRPNDIAAHTMVARLLYVQGKHAESRARFEKILSIDPRAAVAANNLAYMDAEAGQNLDIALTRAQTAKAVLPEDPDVNDTLGWVYYKQGLAVLAIPPLELSVAKNGSNPLYRYHLGMAYLKAGQKDKARDSLQRALALDGNFDGARDARTALASIQGQS